MKNIAVFFGGVSVEHDVSVITGVLILNTLDKKRYNPVPIYVEDGNWYTGESLFDVENYKNLDLAKLKKVAVLPGTSTLYAIVKDKKLIPLCPIAVAINCMHGARGEDGSLSGYLNMCNIPIASPDILPSAVSMDKYSTKIFLKGLGVKTLPSICCEDYKEGLKFCAKTGYPVMVKPYKLGSSIGVKKVDSAKDFKTAFFSALRYGNKVLVEPCLSDFSEINCAAYLDRDGEVIASECERPKGESKYLSFSDKYCAGTREFPANIPDNISKKIKGITSKVYKGLSFTGIIRIDYFLVGDEVILNEINSVPGSLAYYLFCDTLSEFSNILSSVIDRAERDYAKAQTFLKKYPSTILNISGIKSVKRL